VGVEELPTVLEPLRSWKTLEGSSIARSFLLSNSV